MILRVVDKFLLELENQANGDIHVVEVDKSAEGLVKEVASGEIDYTVTQENLGQLQGSAFKNLLIRPVIGARRSCRLSARP